MSIHGVNARQLQIISILKEAKCTNTAELQEELGVSRRTLRTDIAYLKRVYPDKLITHRGRYTGGLEYGKKGVGLAKNPKRAVKNAVYKKTTVGVKDLLK